MVASWVFMLAVLIPLIVLGGALLLVIWIVRSLLGRQKSVRGSHEDQVRLAEMHSALGRMEQRIENLETILMQRDSADKYESLK